MNFLNSSQRTFFRRVFSSIALASVLAVMSHPAQGQDFNLSRDFDTNSNPSGVWAYGWKSALGTAFNPVTYVGQGFADNGVPFNAWSIDQFSVPAFYHYPLANSLPGTNAGGQDVRPPGSVVFFAGDAVQNYGVIRFTAPSNGLYEVAVAVRHYLNGDLAGDTDFHIVTNNVPFFSQFLIPTASTGYTNKLLLAAGNTVDFAVGRGADGSVTNSGLDIQLVITPQLVLPIITQQPQSTSAKTGKQAVFSVVATGENLSYQWYLNGSPIRNATAAVLKVRPVRPRDAGNYTVRVTNAAGSVLSSPALLTVQLGHSGRTR